MKRKKYGEETIAIRIPASRKEDVLKFLEKFVVIGDFVPSENPESSTALYDAYMQGFMDCFDKWEEYHHSLPYIFTGNSDSVPLFLDVFRGRVPESLHKITLDKLVKVLMSCPRKMAKIENQLLEARNFLDDSFDKARIKAQSFVPVNKQITSDSIALKEPLNNELAISVKSSFIVQLDDSKHEQLE